LALGNRGAIRQMAESSQIAGKDKAGRRPASIVVQEIFSTMIARRA
jgi:hypothetical protein